MKKKLNEVVRRRFPELNWTRIDAEVKTLLSCLTDKKEFSLIRMGDGELRTIQNPAYLDLNTRLLEAVSNCDLLGLPDDYMESKRRHRYDWDVRLVNACKENGVDTTRKKIQGALLFLYVPELIGELIGDKRILIINSDSKKIKQNMQTTDFRNYYNLVNPKNIETINVPSGVVLPSVSYRFVLDDVDEQLDKCSDFEIALVGAGLLGKIFCDRIKRVHNKVAIDIGCLMSAYSGNRNRVIFRRSGAMEYLLWAG